MSIIKGFAEIGYYFTAFFFAGFALCLGASAVPGVHYFFSWLAARFRKKEPRP